MRTLVALAALPLVAACSSTAPVASPASPSTSPTPGGSSQPSAAPTATAATPSAAPAPPLPSTPVPAGFTVQDLSFAGGRAFALGRVHGTLMLAGSDDSGRSWRLIGTLPTGSCAATKGAPCINFVRFGSTTVGYSFLPSLMTTTDGGAHWVEQTVPNGQGGVFAVAAYGSQRAVESFGSVPCGCTLRYTMDAGAHWVDSGFSPTSGGNSDDKVVMQSDIAYATQIGNSAGGGAGGAAVDASTDGGATWHTRGVPCGQGPLTADIAATSGDIVAVLCLDRTVQPYVVTLRVSRDGGQTFGAAGAAIPSPVAQEGLGLASASSAAVGTSSEVLLTNDAGQHWHKVLGCGPDWLGFESATEAHAVCGNTIWRSSDGAASWQGYTFH